MLRLLPAVLFLPVLWPAERQPVIVDTDSGLFGDDGAAVVMLVRSPEQIALQAITVVPGNVWPAQGAEYMLHILDLLHKPEIPLYLGAEAPLMHTAAMAREFGRRWGPTEFIGAFAQDPNDVKPAPGTHFSQHRPHRESAIAYLISEIEKRPGEITILAIGPMTNIAMALKMKPEIETKIKRIVFMGGNVRVAGNASASAEFNFFFDPEAASIVLRSKIPQKVMFGLDICNTAPIRKTQFDEVIATRTPITDLFREDLGNRYPGFFAHPQGTAYMWDSLAAAYLLDPGFVTKSETRYLDVVTAWGKFYGATFPLNRRVAPDATPVQVALELDYNRVFRLYKEKLTRHE